jgi:hypothetical protein
LLVYSVSPFWGLDPVPIPVQNQLTYKDLPHPLQAVKYYTVMDMNPDPHFRIPEPGVFKFEYKKLKQEITVRSSKHIMRNGGFPKGQWWP